MTQPTIIEAILRHASARPDQDALVVGQDRMTWAEFVRAIRSFSADIQSRGVGEGDRVGLISRPSVAAIAAYVGTVAAGATVVPLPMSLQPDALLRLLKDCDPSLLVSDGDGRILLDELPLHDWSAIGLRLGNASGAGDAIRVPTPELAFNIIYSSGTTGQPKGIVHSHEMRNAQAARGTFGLDPSKRMLLATPLYSNTTLVPMLAALYEGAAVCLMEKFDTAEFLRIAEQWHATHTMLVPVQYRRIMDHPDFDGRDLSSMELKQSTGAPLDQALKRDLIDRFPGRLLEVYGLTEGGVSTALDAGAFPDKLHTVGRPVPPVDLRIIDDKDHELAPGKVGEIVGWSPWMMSGYWGQLELSAQIVWRDRGGRAFFRSGDLGRIDPDGFFQIVGRRKEMINSGGFNIYPVDLETVLLSHPMVSEAAVIAIPSRKWGETPYAAVVLKPDARAGMLIDAESILSFANHRLGKTQRIAGLDIRDELPRSSIGKVLKVILLRDYEDRGDE